MGLWLVRVSSFFRDMYWAEGFIAPSDKLNIAGVGAGGKGSVNIPRALNNGAENIVALCDVDDRMAAEARNIPMPPTIKISG